MTRTPSIPWWLWPNVLNLDAPVVAVLWLTLFAKLAGIELSGGAAALLFLSVWEVYFADHWLDGTRTDTATTSARHIFHQTRSRPLLIAGLINVPVVLGLAWNYLPPAGWIAAMVLALATGIHFFRTHWSASARPLFPKEIVVGTVFACGTLLIAATHDGPFDRKLIFPGIAFALLCISNCCFVTIWEKLPGDRTSPSSLPNRFPKLAKNLIPLTLALGIFALLRAGLNPSPDSRMFYGAVAATALGFLLLHQFRDRWSGPLLRVLADVAMLTPVLAFLVRRT